MPAAYKGQSGYHAAWGLYYEKKGVPVEALRAFQRALQIDPLDELAIDRTVAVLRRLGREADAQAVLAEAVAGATGSVLSLNQLAVVALRQPRCASASATVRAAAATCNRRWPWTPPTGRHGLC